jgi:hypothetical protein
VPKDRAQYEPVAWWFTQRRIGRALRDCFPGRHCWGCRTGRGEKAHTLCPPHAQRPRSRSDQKSIGSAQAAFCGDRPPALVRLSVPRNWRHQGVASRVDGAVEVITRHALAAGAAGSAPCDRAVVQQNPRTGVDIQSYRASAGQCL